MKFCKATGYLYLNKDPTYGLKETETAEMKFLRSATGFTRPDRSRSHWKYHVKRMEDRRIPKKIVNI
jgi:hypothetical protein